MRALTFWKTVTADQADLLERLIGLLAEHDVRYCVIGGQAVNAYAEPVVSFDLDLVVAVDQLAETESLLATSFAVSRFHTASTSRSRGRASEPRFSSIRDTRASWIAPRSATCSVWNCRSPRRRACCGKVWAVQDATRRGSKRQKDLADIARLLEVLPNLRAEVPDDVLARLM